METSELNNDLRGWIMCLVSGVACVLGASVINVDVIIRLFPGKKNFRVQDSNAFLAASLSLSFGVMLFMSLYSMLPSAKKYLKDGGMEDPVAGLVLMASFVGGFVGIQFLSRLFHQFLPSHVVDCDHSHEDPAHADHAHDHHGHGHGHGHSHTLSRKPSLRMHSASRRTLSVHKSRPSAKFLAEENGAPHENTPLISHEHHDGHDHSHHGTAIIDPESLSRSGSTPRVSRSRGTTQSRRPSILQVQKRVMSFMKDTKSNCDESGPCFGYTDPCGQECFKHLSSRASLNHKPSSVFRATSIAEAPVDEEDEVEGGPMTASTLSVAEHRSRATSRHSHHSHLDDQSEYDFEHQHEDPEAQHHHHVPENAFLSIGLQTSIAIALHKFPEGFITYATNHANPELGFSVFLALFVHNISEGFAMALPLYMALNSRTKAILWSTALGGLTQPLGAGIAAIWIKIANRHNMTPDEVAYGCLFAITSGIMASVAIQLFVESLSLNHNRNLSTGFAFLGMTLLGVSSAFTSHSH